MLDATKPTDQEHSAQLPFYIRQTRTAVNAITALDSNIETTVLNMAPGTTGLVIPTHLTVALMEVILLTADGICNLATLQGGVQGQIKIFVFGDANVNLIDGAKADGNFYLNQLPVGSSYEAEQDDVIAFVNIGGNGIAVHGYWKELWRTQNVK